MSKVPPRKARWWGALLLIVVVMLAAGIGQTRPGQVILKKVGLFKEPASYTSLAFMHPTSLPVQLMSKQAAAVSFIIRNNSGITSDYQWSVSLVQGQRVRRVAAGRTSVISGHAAAITSSARISCTQGKVRIVVSLVKPTEYIDAWTVCKS